MIIGLAHPPLPATADDTGTAQSDSGTFKRRLAAAPMLASPYSSKTACPAPRAIMQA